MAKLTQFGDTGSSHGGPVHCSQCEAMLTDALDGVLSTAEQNQFDLHVAGCTACSQMFADAQRGAAWLEMLRTPRPEPPAALFERILSQTSDQNLIASPADILSPKRIATILPFRNRVAAIFSQPSGGNRLQPRLAMTAAMAFFSIGLTLNLTGIRLHNLTPSSVRRNFYQANAHVVRYVDNMRVVYELESRVNDMQHMDGNGDLTPEPSSSSPQRSPEPEPTPKAKPEEQKQKPPRPGSDSSRQQEPTDPHSHATFRLVGSPSTASASEELL